MDTDSSREGSPEALLPITPLLLGESCRMQTHCVRGIMRNNLCLLGKLMGLKEYTHTYLLALTKPASSRVISTSVLKAVRPMIVHVIQPIHGRVQGII